MKCISSGLEPNRCDRCVRQQKECLFESNRRGLWRRDYALGVSRCANTYLGRGVDSVELTVSGYRMSFPNYHYLLSKTQPSRERFRSKQTGISPSRLQSHCLYRRLGISGRTLKVPKTTSFLYSVAACLTIRPPKAYLLQRSNPRAATGQKTALLLLLRLLVTLRTLGDSRWMQRWTQSGPCWTAPTVRGLQSPILIVTKPQ